MNTCIQRPPVLKDNFMMPRKCLHNYYFDLHLSIKTTAPVLWFSTGTYVVIIVLAIKLIFLSVKIKMCLNCSILQFYNICFCHCIGSSPPPTQQAPHSGALLESELPSDLFSAVFKSQMSHCAWQALLAYAITLQQPFLAILAGSYEVCNV